MPAAGYSVAMIAAICEYWLWHALGFTLSGPEVAHVQKLTMGFSKVRVVFRGPLNKDSGILGVYIAVPLVLETILSPLAALPHARPCDANRYHSGVWARCDRLGFENSGLGAHQDFSCPTAFDGIMCDPGDFHMSYSLNS